MKRNIVIRDAAARDLRDRAVYLNRQRRDLGSRFLKSAHQLFGQLAKMPGLGTPFEVRNPQLDGLRCKQVPKFKHDLIFYLPIEHGIEIVRVYHSSRDIDALLDADDDEGLDPP